MPSPETLHAERASASNVRFRAPRLDDGAEVWRMARDSGALDANSPYAYLMWCEHFAESSVVAEVDGAPVGFVCGFRPPRRPEVLFVWQVAVSPQQRGRGLAARMVHELIAREPTVRFIEATVTPSNEASRRLFRSIARDLDARCDEQPHLRAEHFPERDHEPETLFRIGPFEARR